MTHIYYPKDLYDPNYRGQLFPLLKPFIKERGYSDRERIATYYISEKEIQLIDNIEQADRIVLPMSWNYYVEKNKVQKAIDFINETKQFNKKVFSFTNGDFGVKIPNIEHLIVLRPSGKRSKFPKNHIGMPLFIGDPLLRYFKTQDVFENEIGSPSIGFCGQTNNSLLNEIKEISKTSFRNIKFYLKLTKKLPQKIRSTSSLRSKVLTKIKNSSSLEANFIERNRYRAGVKTKEEREITTLEFYNNIKNTDYTVCIRGAGNFSVRFYETLAMGRIPIFINTDCILPLADKIDWQKHVVWVEENEINQIEKLILAFHHQHTPEELIKVQESNRKLWEEKLTLGGFFKTIFNA